MNSQSVHDPGAAKPRGWLRVAPLVTSGLAIAGATAFIAAPPSAPSIFAASAAPARWCSPMMCS